jgi:hypothetical protein
MRATVGGGMFGVSGRRDPVGGNTSARAEVFPPMQVIEVRIATEREIRRAADALAADAVRR